MAWRVFWSLVVTLSIFTSEIDAFASFGVRSCRATNCRSAVQPSSPLFATILQRPTRRTLKIKMAASAKEYDSLKDITVYKVSTNEPVSISEILSQSSASGRCLMPFTTHYGDLSSFELCQKLRWYLPKLKEQDVSVVVIGIGNVDAAKRFAQEVPFPEELMYCDPSASCAAALSFQPGFGRQAGSPGTLSKVLYGYLGDRNCRPEWLVDQLRLKQTGSFPYVDPGLFDRLGSGYLRPFELATLRLQNMISVLSQWDRLIPDNQDLVVQQGGSLVWDGRAVVWRRDDLGILSYAPLEEAIAAAAAASPAGAAAGSTGPR